MKSVIQFLLTLPLAMTLAATSVAGSEWSVPLAGNTFRTGLDHRGGNPCNRQGMLRCSGADDVYSVFFHVDRPGNLSIAVKGRGVNGVAKLLASVDGQPRTTPLRDEAQRVYSLGQFTRSEPGYVQVDLRGDDETGNAAAELSELLVSSDTDNLTLDYVKSNQGNMFYWGRRGPSVHLGYQLPKGKQLTYAYNEVTVPIGQDRRGAYFMANGFGEGYFGIQVNSDTERRVLFSVWSPFRTDNPAEIPSEDRVTTPAKGKGVHAQDFGNEGSGGQSYLVYPWKAGVTYRFLTEVKPDGQGNTQYTSWFGDKKLKEWRLIASFLRPKTDKHLTGFHSFLENFSPNDGHLSRSAHYGNQWVCDTEGAWHEITRARFTGDATARGQHRLDFAGGSEEDHFFLRHCGFFADQVALDQFFLRESTPTQKPQIDLSDLPRH
ncbi:DUF3472 domain-containing protein [Novipirellula artificiosorum]|uniref:DUF5077 domain-containing protein n=1 Tax=Novipirellula artificiosorum TaxID=2528016 RepID=A0A5C6DH14_9BACT|nr:DUF3472 domain-containing protein [Novipirellula artificiosorum]TWU35041.1 hypothetical protein Poly41_41850 [Novipirellula artificiosorum]